ncbi:methyltransferase type 11 [Sphingorhabdus sp. SMR4y]|uniref:methyltransferase type 11 n=1 Tax=Sphingorhabdus sp. SMR4y TaxID=2584094 RepID=UPI000B5CB8CF|nr:methyltransferase type 11 [Sphingorhabdus sp. SMR4y]ASK89168.1 hypothetical protein SPHFLASMR4Y_02427 [Sphingorhabdus sp. SMR4y]
MRLIEAKWLQKHLNDMDVSELSPLLEIGSSSLEFRTVAKPHIEKFVHAPLRERGVRIITTDLRDAEGVEIVGDIFDPVVGAKLQDVQAKSLLLCNLLEHLVDPAAFAAACKSFVRPGGYIIVTVPYDYPYHLDPIDTMYRPTPEEIHALFPDTRIVDSEILVDGGRWSDLRRTRTPIQSIKSLLGDIARLIMLRGGIDRAKSRASRLSYLARKYKISAVILRTQED